MTSDSPTGVRGRHLPALDGVRALAIAGVVAYHLGAGWARGGYLGVDLFFVLSGFLITSLLFEEQLATRRIALGQFWLRRARRLLPGLLLLLLALALAAATGALVAGTDMAGLRGDALSTLAYVANWHQLLAGQSYFAQFTSPSPLQHTWSLAIEEQFYLLWPLALVALSWRSLRAGRSARAPMLTLALGGALASATWMGWLAAHGASLDRLYYGTDTRAFELLAGAALALWRSGRLQPDGAPRRAWHLGAVAGLALTGVLWATAGGPAGPPRVMFEGGMALAVVCAVVLVDGACDSASPLARLLSVSPLRALGRISYSLYLWHWPIITEMTSTRLGFGGAGLVLVRLATMTTLSTASYVFVERPLRAWRAVNWHRLARAVLAPAAMVVTAAATIAATTALPAAQAAASAEPAGAVVAGAGGLGGQAPVSLTPVPSPAHPLRVDLVGDSVMRSEAPAVEAALRATGAASVVDRSYPGWGLVNDRGWRQELPKVLAATRPQVVVATWSWDDQWVLSDPAGFRRALDSFVGLLLHPPPGAPAVQAVLFEQFPPLGASPAGAAAATAFAQRVAGVRAWNALVSTMPARFPGRVQYLPVAGAVELDGRFSSWLAPPGEPDVPTSQWVRVRSVDGTHLCPAGAARYASALASDLRDLVDLPAPQGAWWQGPWVNDGAVYDNPSGSCPDDHPT